MTATERAEVHAMTLVDKLLNETFVSQEWLESVNPRLEHGKPIMVITIEGGRWRARAQLERVGARYLVQKISMAARTFLENGS